MAPGLSDTMSSLGGGPHPGLLPVLPLLPGERQPGSGEFPPGTATTSVTACTAQTAASTRPARLYVLLRRPLPSTDTGPS